MATAVLSRFSFLEVIGFFKSIVAATAANFYVLELKIIPHIFGVYVIGMVLMTINKKKKV